MDISYWFWNSQMEMTNRVRKQALMFNCWNNYSLYQFMSKFFPPLVVSFVEELDNTTPSYIEVYLDVAGTQQSKSEAPWIFASSERVRAPQNFQAIRKVNATR